MKTIVGAASTWPLATVAQQGTVPIIGFLGFRSANESAGSEKAFREGLSEIGYRDGQSVHIAFRWAEGRSARTIAAFDASAPRCGRVQRQVKRCFYAADFEPRTMRQLARYASWHRWSVRRALLALGARQPDVKLGLRCRSNSTSSSRAHARVDLDGHREGDIA